MLSTTLFNLGMFAVDVYVLKVIQKRPNTKLVVGMILILLLVASVLAVSLGRNGFDHFRLMSYALFGHVSLVSFVSIFIFLGRNKVAAFVLAALSVLLVGIAVDAFLIEPKWLEISTFHISNKKIQTQLRILVFSDLQTDEFGEFEKKAFSLAIAQKPDLILLTGDYFQTSDATVRTSLISAANDYLQNIGFKAPLGAYAVRGDVDADDWIRIFSGTAVKPIITSQSLKTGGVQLTALDRPDSRKIDLKVPPTNQFHIVFGHSPNFARGKVNADLLIAGHTHGGQVQLPLIGPLYVHSKVPRRWASGITDLDNGKILIVSRGIGMERGYAPRIRFLCRPEIVIIELFPETKIDQKPLTSKFH